MNRGALLLPPSGERQVFLLPNTFARLTPDWISPAQGALSVCPLRLPFDAETDHSFRVNSNSRFAFIIVGKWFGRSANLHHSGLPRIHGFEVGDDKGHLH